jgi:hypothetical protein
MSEDEQEKEPVTADDLEREREEEAGETEADPWAKFSTGRDPDE